MRGGTHSDARAPLMARTMALPHRRHRRAPSVGVGFSALPRRLRRVDRRNRSRSCQRLPIPSTLLAFGPRPASRQPGTRTFVTERDFVLQSKGLDCAGMRSNRHRSHSRSRQLSGRTRSCDRATRRCAPVMADTLPRCVGACGPLRLIARLRARPSLPIGNGPTTSQGSLPQRQLSSRHLGKK